MRLQTVLSAPNRHAALNPGNVKMLDERRELLASVLRRHGLESAQGLRVFEAGCASGYNLREFIQLGARPSDLVGIELQEDRLTAGRELLPSATIHAGDARYIPEPDGRFDIALAFTLFSSVQDDRDSAAIAAELMRITRPGGLILVYDMRRQSRTNGSVHPIRRDDIDRWFAGCRRRTYTLTVAPPLARRVPALYGVLRLLPPLRTHEMHILKTPKAL